MTPNQLTVDLDRNLLCRNGMEIKTQPMEAEIATVLLERRVTHVERLMQRVYGNGHGTVEALRVRISLLRRALRPLGCAVIHHGGRGYELVQSGTETFCVSLPASLGPRLAEAASSAGVSIESLVTAEMTAAIERMAADPK